MQYRFTVDFGTFSTYEYTQREFRMTEKYNQRTIIVVTSTLYIYKHGRPRQWIFIGGCLG